MKAKRVCDNEECMEMTLVGRPGGKEQLAAIVENEARL